MVHKIVQIIEINFLVYAVYKTKDEKLKMKRARLIGVDAEGTTTLLVPGDLGFVPVRYEDEGYGYEAMHVGPATTYENYHLVIHVQEY